MKVLGRNRWGDYSMAFYDWAVPQRLGGDRVRDRLELLGDPDLRTHHG